MPPRILICSASVGSGHGRAAQAVADAVQQLRPEAIVRHVDVLNLANPFFRRIYGRGYFDAIDLAPHVVRYFYDRFDRQVSVHSERVGAALSRLNLGRFIELLVGTPWDLVISTHFLPPQIISFLRRAGRVSFPHAVVTTDLDIHRLWVHSPVDRYFTATEEGRANLAGAGIPINRIFATGIPIDPIFCEFKSKQECRAEHGISGKKPVILQLAGGQGFGPTEKVHRALLEMQSGVEIIAVTGRNAKLREALEAIPCPSQHERRVLGFTTQMDELMLAADLIVSKPGGLTSSEALARGTPIAIIEPIPGQEDHNSDYLLENGAAIKINNLASLPHKLTRLFNDSAKMQTIGESARRIGRPFAAYDIAKSCISLIEHAVARPERPPVAESSRLSRLRFGMWRRSARGVLLTR